MQDQVYILAIMEIRGLDVEQVRWVFDHQLVVVDVGLLGGCIEVITQQRAVQDVYGQPVKVSHLQCSGQLLEVEPELYPSMVQGPVVEPSALRVLHGADYLAKDGLHFFHTVQGYLLDL